MPNQRMTQPGYQSEMRMIIGATIVQRGVGQLCWRKAATGRLARTKKAKSYLLLTPAWIQGRPVLGAARKEVTQMLRARFRRTAAVFPHSQAPRRSAPAAPAPIRSLG